MCSFDEERGVDECGIRENKKSFDLLPTCQNRRDVAYEKSRIVLDYLNTADVDPQDRRQFIKNRDELAQELFDIFHQVEDNKLSLWAMTVTFIVALFFTGLIIIYYASSSPRLTYVDRPFDMDNSSRLNNSFLRI